MLIFFRYNTAVPRRHLFRMAHAEQRHAGDIMSGVLLMAPSRGTH
jgi:hypothetical protein